MAGALTFVVFTQARNWALNSCMDRIYYPIEPLYRITRKNFQQKSKDPSAQPVPVLERMDLTKNDKRKAGIAAYKKRQQIAVVEAG